MLISNHVCAQHPTPLTGRSAITTMRIISRPIGFLTKVFD